MASDPLLALQGGMLQKLAVMAWGHKVALQMGYRPFGDQIEETVDGVKWFAWGAQRQDGTTCMIWYPEGGYTLAQTKETTIVLALTQ